VSVIDSGVCPGLRCMASILAREVVVAPDPVHQLGQHVCALMVYYGIITAPTAGLTTSGDYAMLFYAFLMKSGVREAVHDGLLPRGQATESSPLVSTLSGLLAGP
jgi:hypothetical protein